MCLMGSGHTHDSALNVITLPLGLVQAAEEGAQVTDTTDKPQKEATLLPGDDQVTYTCSPCMVCNVIEAHCYVVLAEQATFQTVDIA